MPNIKRRRCGAIERIDDSQGRMEVRDGSTPEETWRLRDPCRNRNLLAPSHICVGGPRIGVRQLPEIQNFGV